MATREVRMATKEMETEVMQIMNNGFEDKVVYHLANKRNVRPDEIYDVWKNDIVVVYRIFLKEGEKIIVTEDFVINYFAGDVVKLRELAKRNTPRLFPPKFIGLHEQMNEMMGFFMPMDEPEKAYVLSNQSMEMGAAAITYPGIFEIIREKIKGAFFVIPSSIHELLIMPTEYMTTEEINGIVNDVNSDPDLVSDDIFLSNEVLYATETNEIVEPSLIKEGVICG